MKKMTKCLLSATVATGILLGSTITALEPQQTKASDINTDIYNANKDLPSWTIEVQLAQKEYDQIDAQFEKMVSLVDDAEEKPVINMMLIKKQRIYTKGIQVPQIKQACNKLQQNITRQKTGSTVYIIP